MGRRAKPIRQEEHKHTYKRTNKSTFLSNKQENTAPFSFHVKSRQSSILRNLSYHWFSLSLNFILIKYSDLEYILYKFLPNQNIIYKYIIKRIQTKNLKPYKKPNKSRLSRIVQYKWSRKANNFSHIRNRKLPVWKKTIHLKSLMRCNCKSRSHNLRFNDQFLFE